MPKALSVNSQRRAAAPRDDLAELRGRKALRAMMRSILRRFRAGFNSRM
jgi:hypothetical protein